MSGRDHAAVRLPDALTKYRDESPDRKKRRELGIDGSEMELRIVSVLVRTGYSDDEIVDYFNAYGLPRYSEEKKKSWLVSLISQARASRTRYVETLTGDGDSQPQHTTRVIESGHNPGWQTYSDPMLRFLVLQARRLAEEQGETPILSVWRREIIEVSRQLPTRPVSIRTARRLSTALIEHGYIRLEARDGRSKTVHLTGKGLRAGTLIRGKWARTILFPKPTMDAESDPGSSHPGAYEQLDDTSAGQAALPARGKRSRRRAADPERARRRAIAGQRRAEQINDVLRLRFKGNRIRYIQLLGSEDDVARCLVWEQLLIGLDSSGLPVHATVYAEGNDSIRQLLPEHWFTRDWCFMAAVELTKDAIGFHVGEYLDEHDIICPRVGIIAQSAFNFFKPLFKSDPIGRIIRVKGTESGINRRYEFTAEKEALPVSYEFDFDGFLDGLFDDTRLQQIHSLPRGWFHMPPKRQQLVWNLLDLEPAPATGEAT